MHFSIDRNSLLKALAHVQSVVERRGTIPVLANVKLETKGTEVSLTGTDMDLALVDRIAATVKTPGATTVPAHMFYDIVRKLSDGASVDFQTKESGRISISAGSARFSLASLPVEDFPVMTDGEFTHNFSLPAAECKALLEKPGYAMSTEETRYYLNGIYLHVAQSNGSAVLRSVATDGHRLARMEVALPAGAANIPGVIIPRKAIYEVKKLLEGKEAEVQISLSESKIRFVVGTAVLVTKLIDGSFPDYERVIPTANDKVMELDAKRFSQSVDRVSVIASDRTRAVKLAIGAGSLSISATSPEAGSASEEIDVTYASDAIDIGFNARYLLEMMAQMEGDTAQLVLNDAASPVLVRDVSDVGALYVIMPMRV